MPLSIDDRVKVDESVIELLSTGAIVESKEEKGQYISNVFTVPKPDGSSRFVINLKPLNEFIDCPHFKMEDIRTAISLVSKNCFMAVIDQKDAYHAIAIKPQFRKYLKFRWNGILYEYTCLPFGLNVGPRIFTKIMKPVLAHLRGRMFISVSYLDDMLIVGKSLSVCLENLTVTLELFSQLGFLVNHKKSQLIPSTIVQYLGFILNSNTMRIYLPENKVIKIKKRVNDLLNNPTPTIRMISDVIGHFTSACLATPYGQLYTRELEFDRNRGLKESEGNYDAVVKISKNSILDCHWWLNKIGKTSSSLIVPNFSGTLTTDASLTGWGAEYNNNTTKGQWSNIDRSFHINVLELIAIYNGLKSFVILKNVWICCRTDNTTAMAHINKYGGCRSRKLHLVAKQI
jgi:hypothetical protein